MKVMVGLWVGGRWQRVLTDEPYSAWLIARTDERDVPCYRYRAEAGR